MSKIALEGNSLGSGTFTIASPNSNSNYTLTLPSSTGTVVVTGGAQTIEFAAGSAASPSITFTGDTNTGIFSPGADTIAFSEGGVEAMRINSSGNVGIGTTSPSGFLANKLVVATGGTSNEGITIYSSSNNGSLWFADATSGTGLYAGGIDYQHSTNDLIFYTNSAGNVRIDSSGNVGVGITPSAWRTAGGEKVIQFDTGSVYCNAGNDMYLNNNWYLNSSAQSIYIETDFATSYSQQNGQHIWYTAPSGTAGNAITFTQAMTLTSGGNFLVGKTTANSLGTAGFDVFATGKIEATVSGDEILNVNRLSNDGNLVRFFQDTVQEGAISVSGNTVTYGSFSGGHWSQLQQGRGYNPEILRGTVMSSIGEMCEWKSVVWDEVIEHPAVPAVEAKEAVLDEEGNVVEPAVESVEGKDAWTETIPHREAYLGNLAIGATFTEDGVTKTVVDDGNERLPKVKISDVVGDKAVYGVFQTWDEVQDMLVTSLGAFVVRIAAGVTVQIGDLLESNGDGCAKVQDDDVIRSRTIGKVTSTTPSATYADGSYTVPAVLYCG